MCKQNLQHEIVAELVIIAVSVMSELMSYQPQKNACLTGNEIYAIIFL